MKHTQIGREMQIISVEGVQSEIIGDRTYHMRPVRSEVMQKVEAGNHSKKTVADGPAFLSELSFTPEYWYKRTSGIVRGRRVEDRRYRGRSLWLGQKPGLAFN